MSSGSSTARKRGGSILVVMIVLAAALVLALQPPRDDRIRPARVGQAISDFSLQDLDGNTVSMSSFSDRPVLINAWATWCPPCDAEMPMLESYYQAHQEEGFVILAINAGETAGLARDYVQERGLTFPILLDPGEVVLEGLGVFSYPTTILVGRDGKVKAIQAGMLNRPLLEEDWVQYIRQ